ncbi:MAG: D-glycero-beta-D-manno-heptose-7-phosphate kinase [Deltaproteobacteria bacterium]|nr:D-glycero-beta-D-manno-heptose-7-phosphate kinase [Deltaproteobacteria bacterium]
MITKIPHILKAISGVKVLCLGDLMLDRYIHGQATRLSPEAPVPIVLVRRHTYSPGGLGNVALNLASLGVKPSIVGLVGDDQAANTLEGILGKVIEPCSRPLICDPDRPTTIKTRVMAGIQQVVRFDEESEKPLGSEPASRYQQTVLSLLKEVKAVAVSDYGKGVVTSDFCHWLLEAAQKLDLPVVIDPKGDDYGRYQGAALVTPNRQELALAVGRNIAGAKPEVLISEGFGLMARHKLKNLLITRSEEGMTLLSPPDVVKNLPTRAKEVYDVTGAGDTVVAVMAAALAAGLSLAEGAELATAAAGVVVGKLGTAAATPEEILSSIKANP